MNAASLYAAIVRVRARQARARRMLAALDSARRPRRRARRLFGPQSLAEAKAALEETERKYAGSRAHKVRQLMLDNPGISAARARSIIEKLFGFDPLDVDAARGGFFGFGKKKLKSGKTKGIAKQVLKLPKGIISPHLFYYVKGGFLYAKKR